MARFQRPHMSARLTQELELLPPGDLLVHADLAEQALEGLVRAPRYATPQAAQTVVPCADIVAEDGRLIGQILFGEAFDILFQRAGRIYGRARRDGIVGWVSAEDVKLGAMRAAYRVSVLDADLPFNALVQGDEGLSADQLASVGQFEADAVAVAEKFAGVAYRAGARSSQSVDAIGLVQQALFACGLAAPRRAQDLALMGHGISLDQAERGDLVVWVHPTDSHQGHAALMSDNLHLVHASAVSGVVTHEQLADVAAGLSALGYEAPSIRRLRY